MGASHTLWERDTESGCRFYVLGSKFQPSIQARDRRQRVEGMAGYSSRKTVLVNEMENTEVLMCDNYQMSLGIYVGRIVAAIRLEKWYV